MPEEKSDKKSRRGSDDAGEQQVAEAIAAEQEKGYRGSSPDPTPNEHYTVEGVTSGKPTPETDEELREQARRSGNVGRVTPEVGEHKRALRAERGLDGS